MTAASAPTRTATPTVRRAGGGALALLALVLLPAPAPAAGVELEAGRFLVASRAMGDPRFAHTVILVVAHGPDGALGLVVNRRTEITLAGALPGLDETDRGEDPLWYGGPVQPARAAVLVEADEAPQPSRTVLQRLHYSTAAPVLETLGASGNERRFRVYAGYAGWAPGQLEGELARGDWTLAPATVEEVFSEEGMALWRRLVGERGTWVRRGGVMRSVVLPHDLDAQQPAVGIHPHGHQHRPAAHAAVLHVPGVTRGAVHHEVNDGPAEGAGG